jgi:hypothetical protein
MHQHQGLHARRGGCPSGRAARPARGAPRTRLPPRPATKDAPAPATEAAPAKQQPQQPPVYIQDAVTTAFLDWAKAAGVAFDRLRPAAYGGLRGLAAAAPIKTDDLILSVPRAAALTLPPRQRCPCPEYVTAEFWDVAPWFARLGVRLLAERAKGGASRLQRYLQQLPKDVDTPVTWSDERLQQLQYPYLIQKVRGRCRMACALAGGRTRAWRREEARGAWWPVKGRARRVRSGPDGRDRGRSPAPRARA